MKITLNSNKLAKALSYVSRSVSTKPNIPVLSNVLLTVNKGMIKLSATNLDMGINLWIAGQVDADGSTTVAARIFTDFVNASGEDKFELKLEGNILKVSDMKSSADFQTIESSEFPILPNIEGDPVLIAGRDELINSLEKVIIACSSDSTPGKSQQTGVLFEMKDDDKKMTLVGLDGYRLSEKKLKVKKNIAEDFEVIVPARSLQELVKILQSEDDVDDVQIFLNESKSQILFKFNEIELSIRLLEGPYPDYKKVLPEEYEFSFEMQKKELESGIKVVNTFARSVLGSRTDFDIDPDSGSLTLKSSVVDLGKNQTEVKITKPEGARLEAAYNLKYLSDMIGVIDSDSIKFETKSALSAAVFKDMDDPDFIHLIMPLKRD